MAEEAKDKPKKKKKSKVDIPTIIFFVVILAVAVVSTIFLLKKPSSKIFERSYANDDIQIDAFVEVYKPDKDKSGIIDLGVRPKDGELVVQKGTYTYEGEVKEDSYDGTYLATFESADSNGDIKIKVNVNGETLTLNYSDENNTIIEFKEKK